MEQVGVQFIAAGGDVYITTVKNATTATNTFVDATEKGGGRVSGAGQVMIGALRQVGAMAVQAFEQAAKATAAFVGDSIKVAGDFEAGMHKFQAVAGDAVDTKGLEKFKDLFISLGKELPVSTSEVEQAAIEMVSGGIDPAIVAGGALRQTIQFAAASGLSLADAAKTSAKFLAGWTSSAATTAEKIDFLTLSTDVLTKAAAASSTTAAELRLGLFNVQGAAQALHASFSDTTATLALLAPAFESSAQAGTALNVFMTRLVPQTDKARDAMEALGLITKDGQNVFFDSQGAFLGMGNAAEQLKLKLSDLTDEQKIDTLHQLFGNDAMKVGNLLMQDGAAGLEGMIAKMNEANGVSATAALMQSGYNTALENAKGSVEALQITIGSFLLPVLTDLMNNVIAPGVNTLTDLASAVFGNDAAFKKLSPTMQDVAKTIQDLVDDFKRGVVIAEDIGVQIQNLIGTFQKASGESSTLNSAINDLNGVWTLALKVIGDVLDGYMAVAQAVLPVVTKFVDEHGTEISAFFKTTWDSIIEIVTLALELYDAIVPPILKAIAGFINDHGSEIQKILGGAWDAITSLITGTLDTIKGVIKLALDLIHGDWEAAWGDIKGIVDAQAKAIGGIVTGFLNIIAGLFDTTLADIARVWEDNWNMLVDIVTSVDWADLGQSVIQGIQKGLDDAWDGLLGWFGDKASELYDYFMAKIKGGSPALVFVPAGESVVQGLMKGLSDMWPSLTALVGTMADDLIKQAASIAEQVQDAIGDAFGATASIDRQMAKNLESLSKMEDGFYKNATENALRSAAEQAKAFADPAVGAKYYKMRSAQIFEFQDLQKRINEETDADIKASLQQQQILILKAQEAEQSAFDATNSRTSSATKDLIAEIGLLFNNPHLQDLQKQLSEAKTDKERARIQQLINEASIPVNDTGLGHDLMELLRQLEIQAGLYTPPPGSEGYTPPPTAQQMPPTSGTKSFSSTRTFNMPIYTNQSPTVVVDSLAIANAVLP